MPNETYLDGTRQTSGRGSTTHNFTDRYAQQWTATLDWMRKRLKDNAAERDRARTDDPAALGRLRARLAEIAGPDVHRSPVRRRSFSQANCENPDDATSFHYRLELENGVRYAGAVRLPAGAPPRAIVYYLGDRTQGTPGSRDLKDRRVGEFLEQGFAVVTPLLAIAARSLREDPERRWYAYDDDEVLHFLGFIQGTSLAGMEAAELSETVRALADMPGLPSPDRLPVALAAEGTPVLSGLVSAALWPGLFDAIVLFDDLERLDHQELDRRSNTLWGFHSSFDSLTVLQLTGEVPVLFAEDGTTASAACARALSWFGDKEKPVRRCRPGEAARVLAGLLPAGDRQPPEGAAVAAPWSEAEALAPGELYLEVLTSKVALLERMHRAARQRRLARRTGPRAEAERRSEIERDFGAVTGPPLPRSENLNPRTSRVALPGPFDAYQVLIETVPGVDTAGYLLIPHGRKPLPAVICQHGLLGRPDDLVGLSDEWIYYRLARVLAEKEYVVYVPFMNWGWGGTPARDKLAKHAYALGITPNRFEIAQVHAIVDFLQTRPEVDPDRIAFYGLSYGGHASLWLGAAEPRLAAVVTAGHFNC